MGNEVNTDFFGLRQSSYVRQGSSVYQSGRILAGGRQPYARSYVCLSARHYGPDSESMRSELRIRWLLVCVGNFGCSPTPSGGTRETLHPVARALGTSPNGSGNSITA